jgi:hypothetical protein
MFWHLRRRRRYEEETAVEAKPRVRVGHVSVKNKVLPPDPGDLASPQWKNYIEYRRLVLSEVRACLRRRRLTWRQAASVGAMGYIRLMPLSAKNNLDELYAKQRLLEAEASRLELELDAQDVGTDGPAADRRYILEVEIRALREESTGLGSTISDILDRDLQR